MTNPAGRSCDGVIEPKSRLFLTAVQDERALARCIEAGGDDFLTKLYNHGNAIFATQTVTGA